MTNPHDLLPGIDIPAFAYPRLAESDFNPMEQLGKAITASDLSAVIKQIAKLRGNEVSQQDKQFLSFSLLMNFNPKVANVLAAKDLLDYSTVLQNLTVQADCLSWCLATPDRVAKSEQAVGTSSATYTEEVLYKKKSLRAYLKGLAKTHLRTVMTALQHADLASIVSDEQSLLVRWHSQSKLDQENHCLHHLGMDIISCAIQHPQYDQVGPSIVAQLAEKMLSDQVMSAVYGKENLTEELYCVQLEPLFTMTLNVNSNRDYGDGKTQLAQLNDIFSCSELLAQKQKRYWSFSTFSGKATNFRKGEFNYLAQGFRQAVPNEGPCSFLAALFLSGSPAATDLLLDTGSNGKAAWQAMKEHGTAAAYIAGASSADLRKIFPLLIKNLGYGFRDGFGNNLAHLLVICPQAPHRQLLNKFVSSAHSFDLFQKENNQGQTPLEAFKTCECWSKDWSFGSTLQRKIQSSRPKKIQQALKEMTQDRQATKPQTSKPKM